MKSFAVVLALFLLLAGCARNPMNSKALYFPGCYRPLQQAGNLDSTARDVGIGAGKGFLTGTLAGLVGGAVSALFTGNALNIVSGAAIGAAGGTVAGGLAGGMQSHDAQKTSLMAMWQQETDGATQDLGFNQAAATVALQCYNRASAKIEKDLSLNLITHEAAVPMLNEIQIGKQEASRLYATPNN